MMAIFPILLILLADAYIWHNFLRGMPWYVTLLMVVPTLVFIILMAVVRSSWYQAWMFRVALTLFLLFVIPKILFTLISLLGGGINILSQLLQHKTPLLTLNTPLCHAIHWCALAILVPLMGVICYGLGWGWKRMTVCEEVLEFKDLPAEFDGYRIVQLSDMHIGTYHDAPEMVDRVVSEVNRLGADMVVFTGDMVNSSSEELDMFIDVMPKMKAKDGIFSIMGNHDYCMYRHYDSPKGQIENIQELQRRQRSWGWDMLLNENRTIHRGQDSIALIGIENASKPPFPDYGDLPKAMKGTEGTAFKVLLSHDPTYWRRKVLATGIQLTLSGHTHATQFKLFGWSPAQFIYDEWGGLYSENGGRQKLFVSTGTGGNLAFRFGAWPQIVVLKLKKQVP